MEKSAEAEKSADAYRTISEVAQGMDLPQHVLRFWETRFPQIKPLKRGGGRRYYRPEDIELLAAIKRLLYGEGYTIKGVQKLLKEQGAQAVARLSAAPSPRPAAKSPSPSPSAAPPPRSDPPMRPAAAPPTPGPALASGDVAALRAVLGELREAERILTLARSA
jgi:DNA-binding transcriptional MerR regulator